VLGALGLALYLSPLRGDSDLGAAPDPTPSPTIPANLRTAVDDRLLRQGTTAPIVGRTAPEVSFSTFEDVTVNLTTGSRPAIIAFFDESCALCNEEMQKLAVASTILFDRAWVGALTREAGAGLLETAVINEGASDLIFAGVDRGDALASGFGIERRPTTVVVDKDGRIVAAWDQSVPVGLLLRFMRDLVPDELAASGT
jgi:predicted DCC family thiol-disulfide oxidoreductase YuxK